MCLAQFSRSWRNERAVDRFVVLKGVILESPAVTGEVHEQKPTEIPSAREPHYQPEEATGWGIQEALSWRSPAVKQANSRNGDRPGPQEPKTMIASNVRSSAVDICISSMETRGLGQLAY